MRETKAERMVRMLNRLQQLGLSYSEALALRRIEMTLSRWDALACGDSNNYCSWAIERDEETEKPYMVMHPHDGKSYRTPIADRERGALKRAEKIISAHPTLWFYHQKDPRGCSLYVGSKADVNGSPLCQVYTNGVAVCI